MADHGDLLFDGVLACADALSTGAVSAVELVDAALARLDEWEPHLNAFLAVWPDRAREAARAADAARAAGDDRPLLGVPTAIKDEIHIAGEVTRYGSRSLTDPAPTDAEVVRRLRDEAGMILLGKTNMPEFGQWAFTQSDLHGVTRNPWDLDRTPGGSSGGSAAAVAAGIVPMAMGADGGGSIRIPAACCGLFGIKVSRGRISPAPDVDSYAGLSVVGPLTRTVTDSARIVDLLRGNLPADRHRCPDPAVSFTEAAATPPRSLRIAVSTKGAVPGFPLAPTVVTAVESVADTLAALGHRVERHDRRPPDPLVAWVSAGGPGIREHLAHASHPDRIEPATRIHVGRLQTPPMVERWALRRVDHIGAAANRMFEGHDVLLTPVVGLLPPPADGLGRGGAIPTAARNLWAVPFTTLWNVAGNPAATVPAGFSPGGVPLAVQLVAPYGDEATLYSLAAQLEAERPWADARPTPPAPRAG